MKVLKAGSSGATVRQWQTFLRGQGFAVNANGSFDAATEAATRAFQVKNKLGVDGAVGNETFGRAAMLGFELVSFVDDPLAAYPAEPDFPPLASNAERQALFGPLKFVSAPVPGNAEAIRITNGWDSTNLVKVTVPQLAGVKGASKTGNVFFHTKAARAFAALWQAWEKAGVLGQVLTFGGAYNPRFIRGSTSVLSNHAFGTAFDINVEWNPLGAQPALRGSKGCVFDLVPIAHQHGFYWGGHFTRRDGMHFEVAKV
jgi:peptidoglycan hydrolase-like protein with peptidoglycan-binding domain